MTEQLATSIQAVSGVLTVLVAAIAIAIALVVERRTNKRFKSQLELSKQTATANAKPILTTFPSNYVNLKSVALSNCGVGTAIMTNISFSKDNKVEERLARLVDLKAGLRSDPPPEVLWDHYWTFTEDKYYLREGEEMQLVKLSAQNLSQQGFDESEVMIILDTCQRQLKGIKITIEYEDVFGNKQPDYERVLT